MRFYLDMDGVMTDWNTQAIELCGKPLTPELEKIFIGGIYKEIEDAVFGSRKELNEAINSAGYDFWYKMKLFPWAERLYLFACETAGEDNVYFLTSPGDFYMAPQAKHDYIRDNFNTDRIITTKHKHCCAHPDSFLVDDHGPLNVKKFKDAGGHGFVWPCQYAIEDINVVFDDLKKALTEAGF